MVHYLVARSRKSPLQIDGANHGRFMVQRRGRASALAVDLGCGHCAAMSEVVSPFPTTWLTYQQVAERLGLRSAHAAASRARRAKWPRRIRNDTLEAEVCVPTELLAAGPRKVRARRQPVNAEADGRAAAEAVAAAVAPLQAIIETLSGELKAARDSNDTLREQVSTAQAESAALKGKAEALESALDREVA